MKSVKEAVIEYLRMNTKQSKSYGCKCTCNEVSIATKAISETASRLLRPNPGGKKTTEKSFLEQLTEYEKENMKPTSNSKLNKEKENNQ